MDARQHSPSVARNREPILDVLRGVVRPKMRVLEIASGTGEHAVYFAPRFPDVRWQPSDPDPAARASIEAWIAAGEVANVLPPLDLDISNADGRARAAEGGCYDLIVAINMIHISPWEATLGLMAAAGAMLAPDGVLFTYGAYKRDGRHTAPSNETFEAWLREKDARFGVRDLEAVEAAALAEGLTLKEIVEMPANNLSLIFCR